MSKQMYAESEFEAPSEPPPSYLKATHQTKDEHDDIDQELLNEAGHTAGSEDVKVTEEEPDDRDLVKNLQWLKGVHRSHHETYPRLEVRSTMLTPGQDSPTAASNPHSSNQPRHSKPLQQSLVSSLDTPRRP